MSINLKDRIPLFQFTIIIGYIFLVVLRVPSILFDGRFWAEEGAVFFADAYSSDNSFLTIFETRFGYYGFLQRLSAFLAVQVPLEFAPIVTGVIALLVQLMPVMLILFSHISNLTHSKVKMLIAVFIILFAIPNQEIWLNTINSRFYLLICTGLILISHPGSSLAGAFRSGLLLLAGLSDISAVFLTPLFWVLWWYRKSKTKLIEAVVISAGAIVQGIIVFHSIASDGNRALAIYPDIWPYIIVTKQILLPLTGIQYTDKIALYLRSIVGSFTIMATMITLSFFGLLGVYFVRFQRKEPLCLLAAAIISISIALMGAIENYSHGTMIWHISSLGAGRYYYAPNVFIALAVLLSVDNSDGKKRIMNKIMSLFLTWALIVGVHEYFNRYSCPWLFSGPDWKNEVRQFQVNPDYPLKIWPRPWAIHINQ